MRVVLDANVLVPILTCDLLLTAAQHRLYQPIWSTAILDEVARNVIKINSAVDPARLVARVDMMRRAFPEALVDDWDLPGPPVNPKDQHVLGVAVATEADAIVTNDRQLRHELVVDGRIPALTIDQFLEEQVQSDLEGWASVVEAMARRRRNPPVTPKVLLAALAASHHEFAANLGDSFGD